MTKATNTHTTTRSAQSVGSNVIAFPVARRVRRSTPAPYDEVTREQKIETIRLIREIREALGLGQTGRRMPA